MVRPIDLQDNLAKTQAAERINQIEKSQGEIMQRNIAEAQREKSAEQMKKAKASEQTDMVIIRKEQDREQKEKKHKQDEHTARKQENDDEQPDKDRPRLDLTG